MCVMLHTQQWRITAPWSLPCYTQNQGCGLGLERLGLETFFWNVSVTSRSWRLNVSVLRVWKNQTSRSRLGLEGSTSQSRLGLEDITSRSQSRGFVTLGLVNIHTMHQACGYISKKITYLTCKKQVAKWQTSPITVFKLRHWGLWTIFGTSRSWRLNVSSHLVSVLRVGENGMSRSRLGLEGSTSRSRLGLLT